MWVTETEYLLTASLEISIQVNKKSPLKSESIKVDTNLAWRLFIRETPYLNTARGGNDQVDHTIHVDVLSRYRFDIV